MSFISHLDTSTLWKPVVVTLAGSWNVTQLKSLTLLCTWSFPHSDSELSSTLAAFSLALYFAPGCFHTTATHSELKSRSLFGAWSLPLRDSELKSRNRLVEQCDVRLHSEDTAKTPAPAPLAPPQLQCVRHVKYKTLESDLKKRTHNETGKALQMKEPE